MNGKTSSDTYLAGIYTPKKREIIGMAPETLTIGQRLRRERVMRKLTLDQMAQFLEISAPYLGAVERGKRPVSTKLMRKLHDRLGISYDYMLEGLSISGNMISQYVRESEVYTTHHNLNVLLNVCSPEELTSCYHMIHTYLTLNRGKDDVN